jgi:hypothetical protein
MLYFPEDTYEKIGYSTKFVCRKCGSRTHGTWNKAYKSFDIDPCDTCKSNNYNQGFDEGIERMKHRIKDDALRP